jgi:hypothetical protein
MAVMNLSSRVIFWKIKLNDIDLTVMFRDYVESISIKRTTLPKPRNSESGNYPSEATITVVSKSYLENLFQEGTTIKIYMGYDRVLTEKSMVFSGVIIHLPDGEAEEMIKYTVKAFGGEIEWSYAEKSGTLTGKTQKEIIESIVADYDLAKVIDIPKNVIPRAEYSVVREKKTDLEMLNMFAHDWGCKMWLDLPNKFYFVDTDKVGTYKSVYDLGYRTDRTECNVESVSWKHEPARVALVDNDGGIVGFGQTGEIKDIENYKLYVQGKTFQVRPEVLADIAKSPDKGAKLREILADVAQSTLNWNAYYALHKYYKVVNSNDSTMKIPADDNSGMEVTVKLNNGDPDLTPPRQATLLHGSINPRADSSHLPAFLNRWSYFNAGLIHLNINETVLSYSQGKLDSELICSIGNITT